MMNRCNEYMKEYQMVEKGDTVIVGVSGGADSVCLLCMLADISSEWGLNLVAVHINHGLRGEEAKRDEEYVIELCEKLEVSLELYDRRVNQIAKERKQSEEEAGRDIRREILEEVCRKYKGQRIALAHHADDNGETMLMNLFRGTGVKGLCGILPVAGLYIRPLLWMRRKEIEDFLKERGIAFCTDSTNLELNYTRNKLRNHVISYVEDEINEKAVDHMNQTMEGLREVEAYLQDETKKAYIQTVSLWKDEDADYGVYITIQKEAYEKLSHAIAVRVIYEAIVKTAGKAKDIGKVHVDAVEELMNNQVGREVHLPYDVKAKRTYQGVVLAVMDSKTLAGAAQQVKEKEDNVDLEEIELLIPGVTMASPNCRIECRVFDLPEKCAFPEKAYTKWIDYDTIKNKLVLRSRRAGDRISVYADGKSQKLKQLLINEKIVASKRDDMLLIADGSEIVWAVGLRMSSRYQIKEFTNKVLEIRIQIDEGEL